MKSQTSLNMKDLEKICPPPTRLTREVTATSAFTFSAKNFVTHRVGTIDDLYEMGGKLGSGGYGEVYSCVHKETGIERAVKILEKSKCSNHHQANDDDVTNEFNILKELDHPNILRQIEMFSDEKNYYIVTEICRGGELFEEIQEWGNFIEEDAAELMRHVLGAVNYCHGMNIAHRDLKPENILLEENKDLDSIKIIDFGLAQVVEKDTEMTDLVGSVFYIAPEVLKGSHTMKADIWSCGVIAYVLISGYAPFDGHSDDDIKEAILSGEFSFDDEVWEDVSDQAMDFITSLLEIDPIDRLTAEEALRHPWIEECRMVSSERLKERESVNKRAMEALHNLERFNAQSKLKQATCAFIASQLVLKDEKKKIDELFRALDINDNGKLTKDDVQDGYRKVFGKELADEMVEEMFRRIDYDNTGFIEYSEFVIATMNEKDLLSNNKLKHAFNMFDTDASGCISKDELVEVLTYFRSVDKSLDPEAIDRIIKQVDENGDGQIDFDEFSAMMFKTAEDAVEEESAHENDDPCMIEPNVSASPSPPHIMDKENTKDNDKDTADEPKNVPATMETPVKSITKTKLGQKPPMKMIPGALGTKACLALFESNIRKNKESGFVSHARLTPIGRWLSTGRAKKRASQGTIKQIPTPVNRTQNCEGPSITREINNLAFRGSAHRPITTRDRAALFEELIKKNRVTAPLV